MFKAKFLVAFSLLITLAVAPFSAALAAEPVDISVDIKEVPIDAWSKNRLTVELSGGTINLRDEQQGTFDDASRWDVLIYQKMPRGKKLLSFDVEVGTEHEALWGDKLLQPIINDKNAVEFEETDGYIPARSQSISIELDPSIVSLDTFSFVTAGAKSLDFKISNLKVTAWPEGDVGPNSQGLHMSSLGYWESGPKTAYIEWPDHVGNSGQSHANIRLRNDATGRSQNFDIALPNQKSTMSNSFVSAVDLSLLNRGDYTLIVPSPIGDSEREISFSVERSNSQIVAARDEAWDVFYWITSGADGPYPKAHEQDFGAIDFKVPTETKDISGGWFDAGDYGKYSVNGAYSVALMLITGLIAPEGLPEKIENVANKPANVPDWLRVIDGQLQWLYKMQRADGAVYHKVATKRWVGVEVTPEEDNATKWLMPVTTTATADFAGAMALASKLYALQDDEIYQKRAKEFKLAAERAISWLEQNPNIEMITQEYDGHQYGGPYDDDDDSDERFFAYAAYAALTGEQKDISRALDRLNDLEQRIINREYELNWRTVDMLGIWSLATFDLRDASAQDMVSNMLFQAANNWQGKQNDSSWGFAFRDDEDLSWGSNGDVSAIGWHWLLWSEISGDKSFVKNAEEQIHYLFGVNALGKTYITGNYANSVKSPHFRPFTSGRIPLPAGMISGGPNSGDLSGDPVETALANEPPMRRYFDNIQSYATNEVAINWQAGWALYSSLLAHNTK